MANSTVVTPIVLRILIEIGGAFEKARVSPPSAIRIGEATRAVIGGWPTWLVEKLSRPLGA
jgi:hypothetical protein